MAVSFIDANGERQQIELNGMALYREAQAKKLTLRQLINQRYPTAADQPETFKQFCVTAGLRFRADDNTGIPAANLLEIFDPHVDAAGSFVNQPAVPDSRLLFPAAVMELIEDKLVNKTDGAVAALESMIAYRNTIATNKLEQPIVSYAGAKGPEDTQFQQIAQNARPPIMLSLTASDISRKIPTTSIGMEISREALMSNSLDIVALTLSRFYMIANYNEWIAQMGYILSGDPDAAVTTMSAATSALTTTKGTVYDSAISTAGTLTQKAWLKYLYNKSLKMQKTHLVCDLDAAMALDNRTNRPTNVMNNSTDRLDTPFSVAYPSFQQNINVVVMPTGTWTANTMMGLDKNFALGKVTSTFAEYEAIEQVVMKKSTELRIDRGFIIFRLYDDAFDVLSLTL